MQYFIRYPGFRSKAVTLSYDDGPVQDIRLMEIMDRNGVKGTFNLNGGNYIGKPFPHHHRHLDREEAIRVYGGSGHEVACHSLTHPFLNTLPLGMAAYELIEERAVLEDMFGTFVRGMAYPMGTFTDDTVEAVRQSGIVYARATKPTHAFEIPSDWLRLVPTCRHKDPMLMQLCDEFLELETPWTSKLFYLWGHSYEFDDDDNWQLIEKALARLGGHNEIWYATNIEIYDYLAAARQMVTSADGLKIYNPTATTLYLEKDGSKRTLNPGSSISF